MPIQPQDTILITCASGKQATPLIARLYPHHPNLRLAVASPTSQARLQSKYPKADVRITDLASPASVHDLFHDISTAYYIGPSFHPHETQCGYHAIDAAIAQARTGSLRHFIFSSVLDTQLRKLLNHDCKRYVEEYLIESGLQYTILQPTHFLDNFPMARLHSQQGDTCVFPAPWDPNVRMSVLVLDDFANVSAKVIEEREAHFFAQYPLCSSLPVPYTKLVEAAGTALGREVEIRRVAFPDAVKMLVERVLPENPSLKSVDAAERMILYYDRYGLCGNPSVLEMLLGRKATTVDEWMQRALEKAKSQ